MGDLEVVVYEVPKGNLLTWALLGAIGVAAMSGSLGISVGFRK